MVRQEGSPSLDEQAHQLAELIGQRVTIIAADGTVLGESHTDYVEMQNHLFRSEIQQALSKGSGIASRYSQTLQMDVMYAAVAVKDEGELFGFARVALPLNEIEANVSRLNRTLLVSGGLIALVAVVATTYVSSRTIRPVRRLTDAVERMAAGDFTGRLLPTTNDEIGTLTRSFNHMQDQLEDKVTNLALEQARLSAILEHMADGVVITDAQGDVVMINAAALRILRCDGEQAAGRRFSQIAHSHQLIDLWNRCNDSQVEQAETVESPLYGDFLHAVVTPLRGSVPSRYMVMLQDLTRIRRLETIRRDFVTNISHELRTPLASLSLVVETLQDGAIDDPTAARRFLSHMETELASVTQLVEELLELSRIESGRVPLETKSTRVAKLVQKPVTRLQPQAERAGVSLSMAIPDDLPRVLADAKRIQQVVTNLVHNAIKFTPSGGAITVFARRGGPSDRLYSSDRSQGVSEGRGSGSVTREVPEIIIGVTDTGVGIASEDVPRIFERFYKTDRARAQDGTGLGLAIAKHIVQGHGGRIWVESLEGAGSTFYFSLPVAPEAQADSDQPNRPVM
jgi:two-component system phosphate regulon sensor histidine kinase PhoR